RLTPQVNLLNPSRVGTANVIGVSSHGGVLVNGIDLRDDLAPTSSLCIGRLVPYRKSSRHRKANPKVAKHPAWEQEANIPAREVWSRPEHHLCSWNHRKCRNLLDRRCRCQGRRPNHLL